MKRRRYLRRKRMLQQKIMGIIAILLGIAVVLVAMSGATFADREATPAVLLLPFGIYLIFTKECWFL